MTPKPFTAPRGLYNPDNENRVFDDNIAKTIFYARSDMILRGRPALVALDEIERGITRVIDSTLFIIRDSRGKRVYGNYSTEDGLKILQNKIERGEFIVGPCIIDEDGDRITAVMVDDKYCFVSDLAMDEAGLKPMRDISIHDNRIFEERVNARIRNREVRED
mgnify:CR=1 FL=1